VLRNNTGVKSNPVGRFSDDDILVANRRVLGRNQTNQQGVS